MGYHLSLSAVRTSSQSVANRIFEEHTLCLVLFHCMRIWHYQTCTFHALVGHYTTRLRVWENVYTFTSDHSDKVLDIGNSKCYAYDAKVYDL